MIYVLTHFTPSFEPIANITIPLMKEYADRHGYKFYCWKVNYGTYSGLHKLNMIKLCVPSNGISLVLDCDTIITNMNIKVESFLEDGKDLYLAQGWNMGAFICRNTAWFSQVLSTMIGQIKYGKYNCEQDAVNTLDPNDSHIKTCDHPSFNSYLSELYPEVKQPVATKEGQWGPEQFICHVPALGLEKRVEVLKELKEKIVR